MDAVSYSLASDAHSRLDKKDIESSTAPLNPNIGDEWIADDGVVYKYITGTNGNVWVDINGFGYVQGDMLKSENLAGLADPAVARTNLGVTQAIADSQPIDEVVSRLASTSSTYSGTDLTSITYVTGNKEVLSYNGDGTLDTVMYYDTDGTTLILTTTQHYITGVWSHETRTEV